MQLSIIIPCYNHAHCIENMLDSIKRQENIHIEIIVVDDTSTDNSSFVIENWAKKNMPVKLIKNTQKLYALQSRIKGFKEANSPHILFLDADDILLGTDLLAKALKEKEETKSEILHFRVKLKNRQNVQLGESFWHAPFYANSSAQIKNEEVFENYTKRAYFPVTFWNKILSKSLVEQILPFAENVQINRIDDKFFITLCMLYCNSYLAYEDYIYEYTEADYYSIEKYLVRCRDFMLAEKIIHRCMQEKNIKKEVQEKYAKFVKQRLIWQIGKMSLLIEKYLDDNMSLDEIYDECLKYLDENTLFSLIFYTTDSNRKSIVKKIERIFYEF